MRLTHVRLIRLRHSRILHPYVETLYSGDSLIKKQHPTEPYSSIFLGLHGGPLGGGGFYERGTGNRHNRSFRKKRTTPQRTLANVRTKVERSTFIPEGLHIRS